MRGGLLRVALAFAGGLPWFAGIFAHNLPSSLKRAIECAFAGLCHHAPERTLVLQGQAMCVCSRCAGIYAGIALAALFSRPRDNRRAPRVALEAGAALMIADVATQDVGVHAPWHPARLLTGVLVGGAAAAWLLASLNDSPRGSLVPTAPPP